MSDCRRCEGTGVVEVQVDPQVNYCWPPMRCAFCNPRREVRPHYLNRVELEPCPDCRTEVADDGYLETGLVRDHDVDIEEVAA